MPNGKIVQNMIMSESYQDGYRAGYLDAIHESVRILNEFNTKKVEELYAKSKQGGSDKG